MDYSLVFFAKTECLSKSVAIFKIHKFATQLLVAGTFVQFVGIVLDVSMMQLVQVRRLQNYPKKMSKLEFEK